MKYSSITWTRLIVVLIFLMMGVPVDGAADAQVTLQWDPNSPDPDGYVLYYRADGQTYDDERSFDVGLETTQTVYELAENITYYFVVRAYVGSDFSGDSNEVAFNSNGIDTGSGDGAGTGSSSGTLATNGGDSGGSWGPGAGCLIQTLLGH